MTAVHLVRILNAATYWRDLGAHAFAFPTHPKTKVSGYVADFQFPKVWVAMGLSGANAIHKTSITVEG